MFDALDRSEEPAGPRPEAAAIFGPSTISAMRRALDLSWSALAFAHFEGESDMRETREELARQILLAAAAGERRAIVLSGRALGALEPRRAAAPVRSPGRMTRLDS